MEQPQNKPAMVEWFDDRFYKVTDGESEKYLPSVTTILNITTKSFLARWRGDIGNEEADRRTAEAMDKGARIHRAIDYLLDGGIVSHRNDALVNPLDEKDMQSVLRPNVPVMWLYDQDEYWQVCKAMRWLEVVKPEIFGHELTVWSVLQGCAGTLDLVFETGGGVFEVAGSKPLSLPAGRFVLDWKTGKSTDDDHFMQVAAYADLYDEMTNPGRSADSPWLTSGVVVHLNATTKQGVEGVQTYYRDTGAMLADRVAFSYAHQLWLRKNPTMKPTVRELPKLLTYQPA